MKSFLSSKTVILGANQTTVVAITGSLFVCSQAVNPFGLSIDGRDELTYDQGFRTKLTGGETFSLLVFHETQGASNTITYYVGSDDHDYQIQPRTNNTYLKPSGLVLIHTNNTSAAIPGTDSTLGKQVNRKSIDIFNNDGVNILYVMDANNVILGIVWPKGLWTKETNATVKVNNPAGQADITYIVCETYYLPAAT
jgi:hypothetical protein